MAARRRVADLTALGDGVDGVKDSCDRVFL